MDCNAEEIKEIISKTWNESGIERLNFCVKEEDTSKYVFMYFDTAIRCILTATLISTFIVLI